VTNQGDGLELRILGPLELRSGASLLEVGGGKQRTLLATLLLRAGDIVGVETLVEELWGDRPPPSALHSLEVYVSRIRQLLDGTGPRLVRRGAGYAIELSEASLDSQQFVALAAAVAADEPATTVERAESALGLWRGRVLADVELGPGARTDAERLEELRLQTLEARIAAQLELGRHEEVIGELHALVAANPYRERFVALLMVALYRSGRHAEALESYEAMRRRLGSELGLQPSEDLQQLAGRIVRQESGLRAPGRSGTDAREAPRKSGRARTRRFAGVLAAGTAAIAAVALSAAGGAADSRAADETRVALVLQKGSSTTAYPASRVRGLTDGFYEVASREGLVAELLEVPDVLTPAAVESARRRLADGRFDLAVLALNSPSAAMLAPAVATLDEARLVFLDTSLRELGVEGDPDLSAVRFASEEPGQLAGALSGLMTRGPSGRDAPTLIGVVAGRRTPETRRVVAAFRRGAAAAFPSGLVRVDYTGETVDPTACELAANRQIDAGAAVIFVHAGLCGEGALAVARARSVRAVASDGIGRAHDNVVGAAFKDWDNALFTAVHGFLDGGLPWGTDVTLGLDGYNVGFEMHPSLRPAVASRVVELCSNLRIHARSRMRTYSEP
jgi:DNA-binding SARP family transcriptional activator/basic membrane lipoprotein Med (substrate-binding protein (PBP1-ABC) superfamily)